MAEKTLSEGQFKEFLVTKKFAGCINIHKSLAPAIIDTLNERGITKDYIYPDTYKMKSHALHKATVRSLTLEKK